MYTPQYINMIVLSAILHSLLYWAAANDMSHCGRFLKFLRQVYYSSPVLIYAWS